MSMAIHKVCGIETEYGIVLRGGDSNPILASSMLVNAYVQAMARAGSGLNARVGWDFEDERPGTDARGFAAAGALPPEVETHLVNAVLTNGARFYVDHAHPEFSSPECFDARSATLFDRAGERVLLGAMEAVKQTLAPGQEIVVYKNNSDGKGNSYGTHENYLMDRSVPFARVAASIMPFFVTRQIFTGSGKVGSESPGVGIDAVPYQLTQRADFFEEEVGLETTLKRPIVNTRDEPHSDSQRYRRLHVIVGDANMSELATFLKLGSASIVLAMIEDAMFDPRRYSLAHSVAAMREVSWDMSLKRPLHLLEGPSMTALEMQWEFLGLAQGWAKSRGTECVGGQVGNDVLELWERVLTGLERDPMTLADTLDWVAKYRLLEGYRERHGLDAGDARLAAMDLQYHDIRPAKSLAARVGLARMLSDEEIELAVTEPPRNTRAYFRGKCLQRFGSSIAAANWDSIVFDLGTDPLRRVPMMEPLRGTADIVDTLLEECKTVGELLARLGA
jgi:Pup amidohydrolase